MAHNTPYGNRESYHKRNAHFDQSFVQGQAMFLNSPTYVGRMGPPPIPLDPRLEKYSQSRKSTSHGVRNDHGNADVARYQDRAYSSGNLDAISRGALSSPNPGDQEANPLLRFWAESGPWNSQAAAGGEGSQPLADGVMSQDRIARPPAFVQYREPAKSDPGSHFTSRHSDSGYATKSVLSADYQDQSQENQSSPGDVSGLQLQSETRFQDYLNGEPRDVQANAYDNWNNGRGEPTTSLVPVCESADCGPNCKSRSEYKYSILVQSHHNTAKIPFIRKHRQRHGKPFICQEKNCTRAEGFSTKNDLDRHKKSVHHINPTNVTDRSFKCAGSNCSKRGKIWPRLDNFKSHCSRMHHKENIDELVKKSEVEPSKASTSDPTGPRFSGYSCTLEPSEPGNHQLSNVLSYGKGVPTAHKSMKLLHQEDTVPWKSLGVEAARPLIPLNARTAGNAEPDGRRPKVQTLQNVEDSSGHHDSEASGQSELHHQSCLTTLSRNGGVTDLVYGRDNNVQSVPERSGQMEQSHNPGSMACRSPGLEPATSKINAEEISRIANDLKKCLSNNINITKNLLPEEIELIIQTSVMTLRGQGSCKKRKAEEIDADDANQPSAKRVACQTCSKIVGRPCDLKKHEKRHSRPWGCTYTNCNKSFGSKNDWKRHESSQHYQLDTWRCTESSTTSKINQCAKLYYRREQFQTHLRKEHDFQDDTYIRELCRTCRIGRNGQCGFWCGFCKMIVKLQSRGLEAWDERFNHIDKHFSQEQRIEDWYPVDKDIPKGQLRSETARKGAGSSKAADDTSSEYSDPDETSGLHMNGGPIPPPPPPPPLPPQSSSEPVYPPIPPQHRNQEGKFNSSRSKGPSASSRQVANTWYCCKCGHGPFNAALVGVCIGVANCSHQRCQSCT